MYFLGFYGYGKSGIICWNIIYWTTINPTFTVRGIIWLSGKFGCHGPMNSILYDGAGLNQFWASSCVAATSNCTHLMKCMWKVQCYRVGTHKVRWTKKPLKSILSEIFPSTLNTGVFLEQYTQNSPDQWIHVTLTSCLHGFWQLHLLPTWRGYLLRIGLQTYLKRLISKALSTH